MTRRITAIAALLAGLLTIGAQAATFNVTSQADSGTGTLRAAIISANATPDTPHTIAFVAPFTVGGSVNLLSLLPTITAKDLTIMGGTIRPTISGQGVQQILRVGENNINLSISNLEFSRGHAAQKGGCIAEVSNTPPTVGTLRLDFVIFSECSASATSLAYGGAIYWPRNGGDLQINHSRFSANSVTATATTGQSQSGGGAVYAHSDVTITNSLFENNEAITVSTITGGLASGGALALGGVDRIFEISGSTFLGNSASPGAATGYGGAVHQLCDHCILEIRRSYFRDNSATHGAGIKTQKFGAGPDDVLTILTNSSFVGNHATDAGGAVHTFSTRLSLSNNTFHNNGAMNGAHVNFGSSTSLMIAKANLFAPTASGSACGSSVTLPSPHLIAANLFSDASCGAISAGALPNAPLGTITIDETPGQVGVVQFTGSAVIDSISDGALCQPIDARSQPRPTDGDGDGLALCDVGAYEHQGAWLFRDGFEN